MPVIDGLFDITNETQWSWIVEDHAPDKDFISDGESVCTISAYLHDQTLLQAAVARCIGYSFVGNDLKINRRLPLFHPRWPWLWCTKVNVSGEQFDGEDVSEYADSPTIPMYAKYRFDLTFEQLPYFVLSDAAVASQSEFARFTTIEPSDEGEMFGIKAGMMRYVSTDATINGKTFSGYGLKVYAERSGLIVTMYKVPYDFICNSYGIPVKLLAARGRVSSASFLGLGKHTMLLKGWKLRKTTQVVSTFNFDQQSFGCNLELHFGYTNPTRADGVVGGDDFNGWLLAPGFEGPSNTGWYTVKTSSGAKLYDTYDMNALGTHWSI